MNKNSCDNLKELYPPTPLSFTERVDKALKALPHRTPRWRLPVAPAAAYVLAACAMVVLVFAFAVYPAVSHGPDATLPLAASATPMDSLLPTPEPSASPLPQLPVSAPNEISAGSGWQIVAASDTAKWYFNAKTSQIARAAEGQPKAAVKLDLAQGQAVDADTFLAPQSDDCIAFTVHGPKGDRVWLVSAKGKKSVFPDDAKWYDAVDRQRPLPFDFSGLSLSPSGFVCDKMTADVSQPADAVFQLGGMSVSAVAPGGNTYLLFVWIQDSALEFSRFTGNVYEGAKLNLPGDSVVLSGVSGRMLKMWKAADGSYCIGSEKNKAALDSNQFKFFKLLCIYGSSVAENQVGLFVYKNDPSRSLWLLDLTEGKAEKVAEGCVAAGWKDNGDYWFATDKDKAGLQTGTVKYDKPVMAFASMAIAPAEPSRDKIVAMPAIEIQNHSRGDVAIPDSVPCSLRLLKNGSQIWAKSGGIALKDAKIAFSQSMFEANADITDVRGRFALKPGCMLCLDLPDEIPIDGPGDYRLEGTLFDGSKVDYEVTLPQPYTRDNLDIEAEIKPGGRLSVTFVNRSVNGFSIPLYYNAADNLGYPPTICYRLMSGETEVANGVLPMSSALVTAQQAIVPAGGRLTFTDPAAKPRFDGLPAGDYVLECFVMYDRGDDKVPWGFAQGLYFDVKFTVPAQ